MIKCPYCGKSHYVEEISTITSMYFPPVYKDGVNVNPDGNIHTTECRCLECNHYFSVVRQYNDVKINKIEGKIYKEPEFAKISLDDTQPLLRESDTITWSDFIVKANEFKPSLVIKCNEIHLTKDSIDIVINNDIIKQYDSLIIDGVEFKKINYESKD